MKQLQKSLLAILCAVLLFSLCACAQKESSTPKEQSSSAAEAPAKEETPSSKPAKTDSVSVQDLQSLYAKAPEYDYMAIGYYDSDYKDTGMLRDGYVPYDEKFSQKETGALESSAHGVSVRVNMTEATSATKALRILSSDYSARLAANGLEFVETNSASTADNDTVGFLGGVYKNNADQDVYVVLYADIRDDGTVYMCAEIEFNEADFDESTKPLVLELDEIYGLTFSNLEMIAAL